MGPAARRGQLQLHPQEGTGCGSLRSRCPPPLSPGVALAFRAGGGAEARLGGPGARQGSSPAESGAPSRRGAFRGRCCCCRRRPSACPMEDSPAGAPSPAGLTYVVGASQVLGLAVITVTGVWMGQFRGGIAWESLTLQLNIHPLCMVIGMVFLQGDALLVYRVFRTESKPFTKLLHGLLHALALAIALVGLVAVFKYHQNNHFPDVYSLHSWCGILAFGGYFVQWLLGLCFFLFPGTSLLLRSRYRPLHVFFGVVLLLLSIATCLLGILELLLFKIRQVTRLQALGRSMAEVGDTYGSFAPEGVLANVLGLLLVAFGGVMGYILTRDEWRRPPPGGGAGPLHGFQEAHGGGESRRPQLRLPSCAALRLLVSCGAAALRPAAVCEPLPPPPPCCPPPSGDSRGLPLSRLLSQAVPPGL
ncbi:hypothetical protein lerEdw1_007516 [Lerista edwardsae]|nr:hypothetical protein lerEdw1_007516 [Lerista edwardsae]